MPPPPPYYAPYRPRPTNAFAIASLVLGAIGGLILSLIFGIVALRQIKRTGEAGKGLAIAGIALNGVWIGVAVLGMVVAMSTEAKRGPSGQIVDGGLVTAYQLRTGDCVAEAGDGHGGMVPVEPCDRPHEAQVYEIGDMTSGGPWPGEDVAGELTERFCARRLGELFPELTTDEGIGLVFYPPDEPGWRRAPGSKTVLCMIEFTDGPRTGSVFGGRPLSPVEEV